MAGGDPFTREMAHNRVERLRRVLLDEWDPIGVGSNPNLADEYDSYIPRIIKALDTGETPEAIAELLFGIEVNWGGVPEERRLACLAVARQLVEGGAIACSSEAKASS
jgi:hypothetical protein